MVDEIFDRNYQAGRAELNAGIDRAVAAIGRELGKSLAAIHRFEWSTPWARQVQGRRMRLKLSRLQVPVRSAD